VRPASAGPGDGGSARTPARRAVPAAIPPHRRGVDEGAGTGTMPHRPGQDRVSVTSSRSQAAARPTRRGTPERPVTPGTQDPPARSLRRSHTRAAFMLLELRGIHAVKQGEWRPVGVGPRGRRAPSGPRVPHAPPTSGPGRSGARRARDDVTLSRSGAPRCDIVAVPRGPPRGGCGPWLDMRCAETRVGWMGSSSGLAWEGGGVRSQGGISGGRGQERGRDQERRAGSGAGGGIRSGGRHQERGRVLSGS
jgi:hypothetical protein